MKANRHRTRPIAVGALALLTCVTLLSSPGQAEQLNATAIFDSAAAGGTVRMAATIVIRRQASEEQVRQLGQVLEQSGQQALLTALASRADGVLRLGALEHRISLVASRPTDRGRRLVLVTARRLKFEEVNQGSDSLDYPFGVAVIELDRMGRGDGQLYTAAALRVDSDGTVVVEGYSDEPGRLIEVRTRR